MDFLERGKMRNIQSKYLDSVFDFLCHRTGVSFVAQFLFYFDIGKALLNNLFKEIIGTISKFTHNTLLEEIGDPRGIRTPILQLERLASIYHFDRGAIELPRL